MAPIKFDENIKEKLNKRSLTPSEKAWDRLSEQLDTIDETSNNKSFWFIGIAASLVGIVLIVSQFMSMNKTEPENVPQEIVNIKSETGFKQKTVTDIILQDTAEVHVAEGIETKKNEVLEDVVTPGSAVAGREIIEIIKDQAPMLITQKKEIAAELNKTTNTDSPEPKVLTFEEEKIQQVVAKIQELEKSKEKVTDKTIDDLLLQAQKEIALNRTLSKDPNLVDAALLLQDVEAELDQSFRIKVFETLKSSYMSLKTAVAQRNN